MDKTLRITLCLFILILVPFAGILGYSSYVESAYRNTITGTYNYSCTLTTDAPLYNVTLFLPVPADRSGNSPMVSGFSGRTMSGIPAGWNATLYDTGKATMVKVTTPAIIPPAGTTQANPFTITISSDTVQHSAIETRDPVADGVMFRPVQDLSAIPCPGGFGGPGSRCFTYTTSLYADYTSAAGARVMITSSVDGKNTWKIFGPHSNEYHTGIRITLQGASHGWVVPEGGLSESIGAYDAPMIS